METTTPFDIFGINPTTTRFYISNWTKHPLPPNFVEKNATHMDDTDPDVVAYGVITCITVGILVIMLYMALFGQCMKATAVRWHVVNCSFWGIIHMGFYSAFADKAPFPMWISNEDIVDKKTQIECFMRSVFPAGMFFVYIEQILLTCAPTLADKFVFKLIFTFFMLPFINGVMIFCFYAQYVDYEWFYNPIELFNLSTYVLFFIMTLVYFVFCMFGSCCCCYTLVSSKKSSRTGSTFAHMWLMLPYGLIPLMMYGPSFGTTSIGFVMKVFLNYLIESGLFELMMGGGGSTSGGGTSSGGGSGTTGSSGVPATTTESSMFELDMATLLNLATTTLEALPWFVLLFPLVQSILTVVCIDMFRQQFFFLLTCGRCFVKEKKEKVDKQWTIGGVSPFPVYPTGNQLPPLKMDTSPMPPTETAPPPPQHNPA